MLNRILFLILILISSISYSQEVVSVSEIKDTIETTLKHVEAIQTYQFMLAKRELIEGEDTGYHYMEVKLQVEPLKVYLKYLKPARYEGREALYTSEPYEELTVKRGGRLTASMVLHILPTSPLAMEGNRYPITYINPRKTCGELARKILHESQFPDTVIRKKGGASIYKHMGTHYRLEHMTQDPKQECKMAEMLISDTLHIPYYYKVVGWNGKTLEEYAFKDMIVNPRFSTNEFDENNPEYGFKKDD